MRASLLYRVASILLVLFAIGHTFGFRQTDPKWGIDVLLQSVRTVRFHANGFDNRTFWDFYVGFGLFVTALMLLAAVFAWQMAQLSPEALASMRLSAWAFVGCFVVVLFLSWRYFFLIPLMFSAVILVCLTLAAWFSDQALSEAAGAAQAFKSPPRSRSSDGRNKRQTQRYAVTPDVPPKSQINNMRVRRQNERRKKAEVE